MTDESTTEPTAFDETATTPRAEHELADVAPTLDDAEREVRIGIDEGDDLPTSPPDAMPRATERDMAGLTGEETIEERIAQEEPDPTTAYGAPDDEGGLKQPARLGGDDPDSIDAAIDVLGSSVPDGADIDAAGYAAEESAMYVEDRDDT